MNKSARLSAVLERLADGGSVDVGDLAEEFGVSQATVRRDLLALEQHRLLVRTHGGAIAKAVSYELPLRYKTVRHAEEKRRIAKEAAKLVTEAMTIGLTGGTTTTEIARALADRQGLTIVTNALNIASELAIRPDIKLMVTGGVVRSQSYELSGPVADTSLSGIRMDLAFIGVDGVDARAGCTTYQEVEAHTNGVMVEHSSHVVVVADGSKVGKVAFARICEISAVDELLTDESADPAAVQALASSGLRVRFA